ncbi:hypothetical protein J421_1619 [Gemmatirosa kalamazoonensis]|uniref:Uncharacterized protein n=1 Tax=Gemmatirosa kalamazoonensis TaxID=861299 RepID=W0REB4_9BACT|nr:hypothetical protein [Gemmatirosa kalamazoonensis]AHG89156.1 hypothetical protein J421_1619 [Gemmatirosa kalamazoonensis]
MARATPAVSAADVQLADVATRLGTTVRQLRNTKVKAISDAQRARLLGVSAGTLTAVRTPIVLSPAKPIKGTDQYILIFSSIMVDPTWPTGVGQALFSSGYPGVVDQGVQVAFPRVKKGKNHLVEFYVSLNSNVAYKFRVFTFPLGDFQDVTIQGPKPNTIITAIAPPVDQISGALQLGASIQQRNSVQDDAGWSFQSVQVNVVG